MTKGHLEWQDRLGLLGKPLNNSNSDEASHFLLTIKPLLAFIGFRSVLHVGRRAHYDSWPLL